MTANHSIITETERLFFGNWPSLPTTSRSDH